MTNREPTIPLAVFGAGGLLAGELLRLVEAHPVLRLAVAATREGGSLESVQPHLADPVVALPIAAAFERTIELASRGPVAIAFGLSHGESATMWKELRSALGASAPDARVVDLGADYRLADPAEYARVYGGAHPDVEELPRFAYGLPELNRAAIRASTRAAAAGCFATAMQLATMPAYAARLADPSRTLLLSGITGSSGSGVKPAANTHHPHRAGNLWAYSLTGHRHEAELAQTLRIGAGVSPAIHFVPHSGPFVRGIHLTAFVPLAQRIDRAEALAVYRAKYEGEPFVTVLEKGTPDLRRVAGSNRVGLGLDVRGDVLTVCLTLDNVTKGGAGQALQCLNLLCGLEETAGLPRAGLGVTG
jgi:N-acetyl-gamma-glutamyl-phosphate/LysW-gamma-L-alpha-aminoadipyl-6-phosphate reductase